MRMLSKGAEEVLIEILDQRDDKGNCNISYWKTRFEKQSASEDAVLRSAFKELAESKMIVVSWGDNYPYMMHILNAGLSYFDENDESPFATNLYINNFYGQSVGTQIQQGILTSPQQSCCVENFDENKIEELICAIHKYDSLLDSEFGEENADIIRNSVEMFNSKSERIKREVLSHLLDIFTNASGSVIATGFLQLIQSIFG